MSSLPTLPHRSWLERATLVIFTALVLIGTLTMAGWLTRTDELLQPPWLGHSTLKFNAALAFTVLGATLLALELGVRRAVLLAILPAALGAATLLEHALHLDLHLDELLARDYLIQGGPPGRVALVGALGLFLSGVVVMWHSTQRFAKLRLVSTAVVGSLVASAGFSTLVGYGAGLPAVYTWGSSVATSPLTALELLLLGTGLVSIAWRESMKTEGEPPAWSPMPVIIGCLTLTLILWVGLVQRERTYIGANTVTAMDRLAISIQAEIDRELQQFERMAGRIANGSIVSHEIWESDAASQWTEAEKRGCRMIEYLDAEGRTTWVYPRSGNEGALGFDHETVPERNDALLELRRTGNPMITRTTEIRTATSKERGFVMYAPVRRNGSVIGYVAAEFVYQPLFDAISDREPTKGQYRVVAAIGDNAIYQSATPDVAIDDTLTSSRTYAIADRRVSFSFTPLPSAIDRRFLPELALLAGFGITALFGLSVHLARRARAGQRAAELSNKRLFAENEERRRIEARLKISDERLRLALDSTQIGIFEWSVAAGHVYYSPGLWAMLGYDHTRMPSTLEAWQALIHPDDLPVYRRRIETQLEGAVSFIEPEYRVRARGGEWRWVYSRSKSVAMGADGRPVRIVGTLQDITARREAELALRESQAEARKLSLVAAKTDNPVLITSPSGNIEWANEAFCRVMEYSLEEVVGKNPTHFMIGPETNQRTVALMRAAMNAGEGISTDIVNYAKSGRKYHLHIEIQPVRSASGELENFIAVETDITARVETEHQLRRAKAEADDASRAKSEFLASMSHEIRTPMNGVIGMTSLLMETVLTVEQRDFVNTIRTSGEALLTIINDILDFSKIESGKMELERAPFELPVCVEEALDLFALQAAARKLENGYYMSPDVPTWIIGDVTRLRQVLVNLVNNAVKFTPSGSISIEIVRGATTDPATPAADATLAGDGAFTLEFRVRDTGIGIPADRVDRLFKAFSQVDSSTTRKYGGTGLGLAICQRLTQLMGGDIRVESVVGQGSSFNFTIQTAPAPGAAEPTVLVPASLRERAVLCIEDHPVTQRRLGAMLTRVNIRHVIVPDARAAHAAAAELGGPPALVIVDGGDTDGAVPLDAIATIRCPRLILFPFGQTAPTPQPDGLPVASVSKPIRTSAFLHAIGTLFEPQPIGVLPVAKTIERAIGEEIPLEVLLAEDNPVNQKVALRFLERMGYRADTVGNGLEAVTAVENRRYDLVLMDVQMPEMDGFEATRQIRSRLSADRQPKIIALTANAMQGDRELCVAAGMDDYISKPVKMHEIATAIRRHFAKAPEASPAEL
jgi:PAS domain S-box-containing protein